MPPRGSTRLIPGDHAFLVTGPDVRALVDRVFAPRTDEPKAPLPTVEFPLSARARVSDLVEFYGIAIDAEAESTLEQLMRDRLQEVGMTLGTSVDLGNVRLWVREMSADGIDVVGLQLLSLEEESVSPD